MFINVVYSSVLLNGTIMDKNLSIPWIVVHYELIVRFVYRISAFVVDYTICGRPVHEKNLVKRKRQYNTRSIYYVRVLWYKLTRYRFYGLSQTAIGTPEKSSLEGALAECKRLEARCRAKTAGGWMREVGRKLFSNAAVGTDDYDRRIALADVTVCMVGLTLAAHRDNPSVGTMARAVYALRRAWKMYQHCYAAVLNVYRNVYDLETGYTFRFFTVFSRDRDVNHCVVALVTSFVYNRLFGRRLIGTNNMYTS